MVPHCNQDEIKLLATMCKAFLWSGLCILSRITSQYDSTYTNNIPFSLWHHRSATTVPLLAATSHLVSLLSKNMPVIFHWVFFLPGIFFLCRESQGLFPSWLSAFYSNISLKLFQTSLFKTAGYVSQLQQTPPLPLLCFFLLHFSPCYALCFTNLPSILLIRIQAVWRQGVWPTLFSSVSPASWMCLEGGHQLEHHASFHALSFRSQTACYALGPHHSQFAWAWKNDFIPLCLSFLIRKTRKINS